MLYGLEVKLFNVFNNLLDCILFLLFVKNWVIIVGKNINVWVKMIGIILEVFIFIGI